MSSWPGFCARLLSVGGGILCMAVSLQAQSPKLTIDGFEGYTWGTPLETILEDRGTPAQQEPVGGGLELVAYRDTVGGMPLVSVFGVHDVEGLMKGQYSADVEEGDDCHDMFITLRESVNAVYPLLRPEERKFHRAVDDFCEAVAVGEAGWMVQWHDPTNESFISVYIRAGTSTVEISFESKAFQNWAERRGGVTPGSEGD